MEQSFIRHASPIGNLILAAQDDALIGLWMEGQNYFGQGLSEQAHEQALPVLQQAAAWVDAYFRGEQPAIDFPIAPQGSAFRQAVWKILLDIPYGSTTTYGAIAKQLAAQTGRRVCAQAVGGAIAHNPLCVIIPCHRVIGSDGSLTGYAGGVDRKRWLLRLEQGENHV